MGDSVKSKSQGKSLGRLVPKPLKPYARSAYHQLKVRTSGPRASNRLRYMKAIGREERINYVPPVFVATINSTCNLRCPNCFYVLRGGDQAFAGGAMMKVDAFKSVIEKYADRIEIVFLTGGEPLAHPKLDQLAEIVTGRGLSLKTSTNGVFIDRKIDVLRSFDYVNVSMDGYDYPSFEKYRGGTASEFDKIVHGLSLLSENDINFTNSFVLSEENLPELDQMLGFVDNSRPRGVIFHNINPHGSDEFTPLIASSEAVQKMLKGLTSRTDYPYDIELPVIFDPTSNSFLDQTCAQQWYYAAFNDKGQMAYCCHMEHEPDIGNMFQGYDFNSDKMREFRRRMINHEYPKDACTFCHRRFMGHEYGRFVASDGKWYLHGDSNSMAGQDHTALPIQAY